MIAARMQQGDGNKEDHADTANRKEYDAESNPRQRIWGEVLEGIVS